VPFTLVSDVDQHKLIVNPQDLALDNRIDRQRGSEADVIVGGLVAPHCQFNFLIEFVS